MGTDLKSYKVGSIVVDNAWREGSATFYKTEDVDALLAEKDAEIQELKTATGMLRGEIVNLEEDVKKLKNEKAEKDAEIERLQEKARDLDAITRCISQVDWSKVIGGKRK